MTTRPGMSATNAIQMDAPHPRSSLLRLPRIVWVMTATSFLTDVSSEMVIHLLPLFLANALGVHTAAIGLIEGIADSTTSVLKVFSGWFSDRIGRRKGITVFGYGVSTVTKGLLYFASTWQGVLVARFGDRVGKGIRTAPRDALIADGVDASMKGLAFGLHRAGDTCGAFLGLLIALGVILHTGAQVVTRETYQTIVLISLAPAALAVLVLAFGAHERRPTTVAKAPSLRLRELPPAFRRMLFITIVFTLGNSSDAFLTLRAQERGLGLPEILGMLITFNAVYALTSGPLGALSDRVGRRRLILLAWSVYAVIYLGFALATSGLQIWVLYTLYGLYYAAFDGASKALIADLVPSEKRGTAYGIFNTLTGVAALPASLLAGVLWQGVAGWAGFGPSAPFIVGALLAALATALLLMLVPDRQEVV